MQGNIRKGQKVFIAQNELIGDFLPFHYKVRDILYDLKTKINVQGVEPVSYTHLDVYKRQSVAFIAIQNSRLYEKACEEARRDYLTGVANLSLIHI